MSWSELRARLGVMVGLVTAVTLSACGGGMMTDNDASMMTGATCAETDCYGSCDDSSGTAICTCSDGWTGADCNTCGVGWTGAACDTCATGWTYGTSGRCDTCAEGYSGSACDVCATGWTKGATNLCDTCAPGYAGAACDTCAPRYTTGATGLCDTCAAGYAGETCGSCALGYRQTAIIGECAPGLPDTNDFALWLDADSYTGDFSGGVYTDTWGTFYVTQWNDLVAGEYFANDDESNATRPRIEYLGGRLAIVFDGNDKLTYATPYTTLQTATGYTLFVVGYSSVAEEACFFEASSTDENLGANPETYRFGMRLKRFANGAVYYGHRELDGSATTDSATTASGVALTTRAQILRAYKTSDPSLGVWVDGGAEATESTPFEGAFGAAFDVLSVGHCTYGGGLELTGAIHEVIIVKGDVTPERTAEIEAYLAGKWGL